MSNITYQAVYNFVANDRLSGSLKKLQRELNNTKKASDTLQNSINNSTNGFANQARQQTRMHNDFVRQNVAESAILQKQKTEFLRYKSDTVNALAKERAAYYATDLARKRDIMNETANIKQKQKLQNEYLSSVNNFANNGLMFSIPVGLGIGASLKNFMQMKEQMGMQMELNFGDSAKQFTDFAYDYAKKTAYGVDDIMLMMTRIAPNIDKIKGMSQKDLPDLIQKIGNVMLAYGGDAENRQGIMEQIYQIFGKGFAENTMDMRIIEARGFVQLRKAIDEIVKADTKGKIASFQELSKQTGSTQIPLALVLRGFEKIASDKKTVKLIENRMNTLTGTWDALQEEIKGFSAKLGEKVANGGNLIEFGKGLASLISKMKDLIDSMGAGQTQLLAWGVGLALLLPPLLKIGAAVFSFYKSGLAIAALPGVLPITIAVSGVMVAFQDWGKTIDDVHGLLKDFTFDKAWEVLKSNIMQIGSIAGGAGLLISGLLSKNPKLIIAGTTALTGSAYGIFASQDKKDSQILGQQNLDIVKNISANNDLKAKAPKELQDFIAKENIDKLDKNALVEMSKNKLKMQELGVILRNSQMSTELTQQGLKMGEVEAYPELKGLTNPQELKAFFSNLNKPFNADINNNSDILRQRILSSIGLAPKNTTPNVAVNLQPIINVNNTNTPDGIQTSIDIQNSQAYYGTNYNDGF